MEPSATGDIDTQRPATSTSAFCGKFRSFIEGALARFPHTIRITDWTGATWEVGLGEPHWCGRDLEVRLHSEAPARDLMRLDGARFLDRFLEGEVDLEGNLYVLTTIRKHADIKLRLRHVITRFLANRAFQDRSRAQVSVKSHYDIPQEALNIYLDQRYMSYSCGIWDRPATEGIDIEELLRMGSGREDAFDTLEKSQWRKFKDAIDYIRPTGDDLVLDVGCGYGGQLDVALESHDFARIVGWTHSTNQVREGQKMLSRFDPDRWELHEGDYREDRRVYDHITSTGMISHVGPRGLVPYVGEIRKRIKTGGRYLHHSLMTRYSKLPIDMNVGIAFNKKYVWPGFHWFTVGEHVQALEENGFQVDRLTNLTFHYAKTTAAWYERMMQHREVMVENVGEATTRAWQVFLAGITGSYLDRDIHVYRLYCVAT